MRVIRITESRENSHCPKCAVNAKTNMSCKSGGRVPELGPLSGMGKSTGESMKRFFALAIIATMAMPLFAADGAATFKAKCAACHGADGLKAMPSRDVCKIAEIRAHL